MPKRKGATMIATGAYVPEVTMPWRKRWERRKVIVVPIDLIHLLVLGHFHLQSFLHWEISQERIPLPWKSVTRELLPTKPCSVHVGDATVCSKWGLPLRGRKRGQSIVRVSPSFPFRIDKHDRRKTDSSRRLHFLRLSFCPDPIQNLKTEYAFSRVAKRKTFVKWDSRSKDLFCSCYVPSGGIIRWWRRMKERKTVFHHFSWTKERRTLDRSTSGSTRVRAFQPVGAVPT